MRDTHPELPIDPDVVQPGVYRWPPHFTPTLLAVVFLGGTAGAAARYWVTLQIPTGANGWPMATMLVNLLGAFLLGLLLETLVRLGPDGGMRRLTRLTLGTGFMGALTTYSTFAAEIDLLIHDNHLAIALAYGFVSITGGIALGAFGIWLAANYHKNRKAK